MNSTPNTWGRETRNVKRETESSVRLTYSLRPIAYSLSSSLQPPASPSLLTYSLQPTVSSLTTRNARSNPHG